MFLFFFFLKVVSQATIGIWQMQVYQHIWLQESLKKYSGAISGSWTAPASLLLFGRHITISKTGLRNSPCHSALLTALPVCFTSSTSSSPRCFSLQCSPLALIRLQVKPSGLNTSVRSMPRRTHWHNFLRCGKKCETY